MHIVTNEQELLESALTIFPNQEKMDSGMQTDEFSRNYAILYMVQVVLGLVALFLFFAGLFNGLEKLIFGTAIIALLTNTTISGIVARRTPAGGAFAAISFSAPAMGFSVFSLGDLLAQGEPGPFLFWFGCSVAITAAGLLGVLLSYLIFHKTQGRRT